MSSTSHRKSVLSRLTVPLTALLLGACGDSTATSETDTDSGSSGSTGDDSTTDDTPTTGNTDTGVPSEGEARYFLRIDDTPVPPVKLEMNKAKVLEVFGEAAAKKIKLLDVDSSPLLLNVLGQIQGACGTQWNQAKWVKDTQDQDGDGNTDESVLVKPPPPDCTKGNDLGKSFGPDWKTSAEFAMVRLLSMTPATADVDGTSLQLMAQAFAENPDLFTSNFSQLLAKSLGIDINEAFIPLDQLSLALQHTLLASHPNIQNAEGTLPVTLYDAVMDMQPLSTNFGPTGDHPGVLLLDDDDFTTHSDALTPEFQMKAIAESNLRLVDGIDAGAGAGSMFVSIAESPLAFDFNDPDKVQMLGIAAVPTVDMRMSISELPDFVASCADSSECMTNYPETPVGTEYIWSTPAWSLERIIGTAGYTTYGKRVYEECIFKLNGKCPVGVWIGPNKIPFPPPGPAGPVGWTQFSFFDVQVPKSQFFWELLLEIAQVAIHDPTGDNDYDSPGVGIANDIPEGEARPVFALKGLPIGLTAEQMIAEIRPNLQAQAPFIANVILGKFWKHNAHLDFYYRRVAPNAPPALFFVHASDPRPDTTGDALAPYTYKNPGFFADAELTTKLSSTKLDGVDGITETDHEKLLLSPGETVLYIQDDEDKLHRLRFYVPEGGDPTEIVVHVHAL